MRILFVVALQHAEICCSHMSSCMQGSGHLVEDFSQPVHLCPIDLRKVVTLCKCDVVPLCFCVSCLDVKHCGIFSCRLHRRVDWNLRRSDAEAKKFATECWILRSHGKKKSLVPYVAPGAAWNLATFVPRSHAKSATTGVARKLTVVV